jgi:siroheme synthase
VLVHDRLVAAELVAEARPDALVISRDGLDQETVNELLVALGRQGHEVVRLKGGDPFVFGRGGEEALALAAAAVPFEVVPGVSAAVAAPAYAGVPLTHRGVAASVAVVSATLAGGPADLARVATAVDTLVVLMVAERLGEVCAGLIAAGRPADEPAAVIASASTTGQRSLTGTLAGLADAEVDPPATLVAGRVAALAGTLAWFVPGELLLASGPPAGPLAAGGGATGRRTGSR